jgi:hypothetical protein
MSGIRTHNFSGDKTDCTCSSKSNYHAITTALCMAMDNLIKIEEEDIIEGYTCIIVPVLGVK